MFITKKCPFTGKINTRSIPVTESQVESWRRGTLIQVAMPDVSADDREFIKTGITPEVWDETFPSGDPRDVE